eukprot:3365043-Prymnesium_polylepis.1
MAPCVPNLARSLLLPSKEMLLSFPFGIIAYEAMKPHGWGLLHLSLVVLPLVHVAVVAIVAVLVRISGRALPTEGFLQPDAHTFILVSTAALAATLAAEATLLALWLPSLPASHWVALAAARYVCWSFLSSSFVYVSTTHRPPPTLAMRPPPLVARPSPDGHGSFFEAGERCWHQVGRTPRAGKRSNRWP